MESKQKTLYMSRQLIEFNHIYKEFNDVYREAATKVGLSLSGFDILYAICEMGDGCLQRDISQMCCIPKQTVNSSIRKLEQDRYCLLYTSSMLGRHSVGTGSAPQNVIGSLVADPLDRAGMKITDIDKYSPEMQNPDITKPAGAGDVPLANYKMIACLLYTSRCV